MGPKPESQFAPMTCEQLALLAAATESLIDVADYEATLAAVARALVPSLADFCVLEVTERAGKVRRVGYAPADGSRQALLDDPRWQESASGDQGFGLLPRAGLQVHIDEALLSSLASTPDQVSILRALAFQSLLTIPLTYHGHRLGSLALFFGIGGRMHAPTDLSVCEAFARRAAVTLENAWLLQDARDAVGLRDDFMSFAGHELCTPLTALQLQVLSIERMLDGEIDTEKIRVRTQKAAWNVVRLSVLLNEVLDVSRISAGRLTLQRTHFALAEPLTAVLTSMADDFLRAGCVVDLELDAELRGSCDRMRIEQVLTSLLSNACKRGKGKPIEVRLSRRGAHACLSVRDFGVAVSLDEQRRIFERVVSSRLSQGLGLGLWIARQIVEAHGGTLRVYSGPHEGSTFEVELALEQHAAHA
jgi:signal transduction histidine kinase